MIVGALDPDAPAVEGSWEVPSEGVFGVGNSDVGFVELDWADGEAVGPGDIVG
jgi:hypothetical protein